MNDSDQPRSDEDVVERFGRRMRRCTAHSKRTGERCSHPAVSGFPVCRMHGANRKNRGAAKPGVTKGNLSAMTHGAYVKRLLDEQDRELFEETLAAIRRDFDLNDSTDQMQASMAAFYFTRWFRAVEGKAEAAIGNFDSLLRRQLESLKTTRAQRDTGGGPQTTPAEWAVALLASVKQGEKPKAMSPPEPTPED